MCPGTGAVTVMANGAVTNFANGIVAGNGTTTGPVSVTANGGIGSLANPFSFNAAIISRGASL